MRRPGCRFTICTAIGTVWIWGANALVTADHLAIKAVHTLVVSNARTAKAAGTEKAVGATTVGRIHTYNTWIVAAISGGSKCIVHGKYCTDYYNGSFHSSTP